LSPRMLENVCMVSKEACEIMTPMVREFYYALNGETSKLKDDKSVFTIADGIVQHLLVESLFGDRFDNVVGEEEDSKVNITTRPYTVDDLIVPEEFNSSIDAVRAKIEELAGSLSEHSYKNVSVFIDPIDGTREFATSKGEQCSICIGFSLTSGEGATGAPIAGIVYRPITEPPTWAAGAKSEGVMMGHLNTGSTASASSKGGFLTSNGSISKFVEHLMCGLEFERVPSGGAGNKMLMLLEGKGNCYIQDRGVSRWDTCGAEAVIEAYGGTLNKLSTFALNNKQLSGYTYRKSTVNTDFVPGLSSLTPYNAKNKGDVKKGETVVATSIDSVKPYSNLCGIIALDKNSSSPENLNKIYDAIVKASALSQPAYD
jgi:3'-phosphoadenosine 5'-phosphosulfate (PAPS) 3'-phosphatase